MSETLAIVDYGSGNLRSAEKAFARAASEAGLNTKIIVTSSPDIVKNADRVVLPGVGAFADCRAGLLAIDGMYEALTDTVINKAHPFFGICVGMQLMATHGLEHGTHKGFGWIEGDVKPMAPNEPSLKIPHMGWNTPSLTEAGKNHPVLCVLEPDDHTYFVHSFHMELFDKSALLATADYGGPITAVVGRNNMVGTQFHPEKSQAVGLKLITAFLEWQP